MNLLHGCSLLRISFGLVFLAALGACGGGGGSARGPTTFTIGGTVSGLKGTVVLQNNGGDNISVTTSGAFTFPLAISSGGAYAVTIFTQPQGQTCTVTASSGTANSNVTMISRLPATAPSRFSLPYRAATRTPSPFVVKRTGSYARLRTVRGR